MNTKQRQREIEKAAWRIHREVCRGQKQSGSGLLLFLILFAVGYWLAHCI